MNNLGASNITQTLNYGSANSMTNIGNNYLSALGNKTYSDETKKSIIISGGGYSLANNSQSAEILQKEEEIAQL